jgi:hypothetical protein
MRDLRSILELRRNSATATPELTPNEKQVLDILTALIKKIDRRETDKEWGELKLTVLARGGQIAEFRFLEESISLPADDPRRKKV